MDRNNLPEDTIVLSEEFLDAALIGIDQDGKAVYDYDLLVQAFMDGYKEWTEEDAIEWIDYNVLGLHKVTILYRDYCC